MAQVEAVPPYVIASDRSLREMAVLFPEAPARAEEFTRAHGIGEAKAAKYGEGFINVLRDVAGTAD